MYSHSRSVECKIYAGNSHSGSPQTNETETVVHMAMRVETKTEEQMEGKTPTGTQTEVQTEGESHGYSQKERHEVRSGDVLAHCCLKWASQAPALQATSDYHNLLFLLALILNPNMEFIRDPTKSRLWYMPGQHSLSKVFN